MKRTALLTAATLLLLAGTAVNALAQNDTTTVPKADTVTTAQTDNSRQTTTQPA